MQHEARTFDHHLESRQPFEPEMVLIPAGEFLMGSDPQPGKDAEDEYVGEWEQPTHTVFLPDFYLARTPVTNAQYAAFLDDTGHPRPNRWRSARPPRGKERFPVVYVSWHDANAYCRWLSAITGKTYRLPSEAEWEKGARGPSTGPGTGQVYPWGDAWDPGRCNTAEGEEGAVTAVDAYPHGASPHGLLDMAGNVWEWTLSLWGTDWFRAEFVYPYDPADGRENLGASDSVCRVLRGGSFAYTGRFARCAYRYKNFPNSYSDGIGFRVVQTRGSVM